MNKHRLEQLLQFYTEDPGDAFNLYALANEYKNDDTDKALAYFEKLVSEHPEYVPTYYHLAQIYRDRGDSEQAKLTYEQGIERASKASEHLLLRELRNAYNDFLFDME
ncbi:MAG: tetratricopeptide repeat protein [Cyclobacteriaceae bacterium]|nr:tetratricopeptide repeat protein [Cyclobacteriaceae bacterium]